MYRNTRRGRSPQWIWYTSQNARTMLQYLTRKFTCKTVQVQTEANMSKSQVSLVGHVDVLIALVSTRSAYILHAAKEYGCRVHVCVHMTDHHMFTHLGLLD